MANRFRAIREDFSVGQYTPGDHPVEQAGPRESEASIAEPAQAYEARMHARAERGEFNFTPEVIIADAFTPDN